jgi:hypothetical protein
VPKSLLGICAVPSQTSSALGPDLIGRAHAVTPPHPALTRRPLPASGERLAPRLVT